VNGKLLAPFLEKPYAECHKKRIHILIFDGGFILKYNNLQFPASLTLH
jgi:hypothetical protein